MRKREYAASLFAIKTVGGRFVEKWREDNAEVHC